MSKFIAIWRQNGGCDYTIGCGVAVHHFEAADLEAAKKFVIEQLSDPELSSETAESIEQVDIIEYVGNFPNVSMLPGTWEPERERKEADLERHATEKKERAEFERLRRKFQP